MKPTFACLGADGQPVYVDGELMKGDVNCVEPSYSGLQQAAVIGIIAIAIIAIIITIVRRKK